MPLIKTMVTYSVLWTVADLTEQKFISKKAEIDRKKTARMTAVGTFVIAPCVYGWLRWAEWLLPGKSLGTVAKKVLLGQFAFAPPISSGFLVVTNVLEGRGDVVEELKEKFPEIYKAGLCFWPGIQAINFGFVPPYYRPFVTASGSFVWSMFLCLMKEDERQKAEKIEDVK